MPTQIFIDSPKGQIVLYVNLRTTGFDIKTYVSEQLKVPPERIWLSYNGGILYPTATVQELGIRPDDTIRCFVR
jgi:hypothetical protein